MFYLRKQVLTQEAHSVRGAAASVAANAGVITSDNLRNADWSSESVFYYKPVQSGTFGAAVLSKGESNTLQTTAIDMERMAQPT